MQLGLRAILLVVAIILFFIAALTDDANSFDYLAVGLLFVAGALLVEELGLGGARFTGGRRSDT